MADEPRSREQGGDPVCWVGLLCPECGAMPSQDGEECCWRCGTPQPRERGPGSTG